MMWFSLEKIEMRQNNSEVLKATAKQKGRSLRTSLWTRKEVMALSCSKEDTDLILICLL